MHIVYSHTRSQWLHLHTQSMPERYLSGHFCVLHSFSERWFKLNQSFLQPDFSYWSNMHTSHVHFLPFVQDGLAKIFGVPERYIDSITFKTFGCTTDCLGGTHNISYTYNITYLQRMGGANFHTNMFGSKFWLSNVKLTFSIHGWAGGMSCFWLQAVGYSMFLLSSTSKRITCPFVMALLLRMPLRIGKYNEKAWLCQSEHSALKPLGESSRS